MLFKLYNSNITSQPFAAIFLKTSQNKILAILADMITSGECDFIVLDHGILLVFLITIEGNIANNHFICENTECPPIYWVRITFTFIIDDFRSYIMLATKIIIRSFIIIYLYHMSVIWQHQVTVFI